MDIIQRRQPPSDAQIYFLWQRRFNTADIAERYGCSEYEIANRMPVVLCRKPALPPTNVLQP